MELVVGLDVIFRREELPINIRGFAYRHDEIYYVVINENLSDYVTKKTISHELYHITNGDFDSLESVGDDEANNPFQ